jgi:hypothetical protein
MWLKFARLGLRKAEGIGSGGEVNWLSNGHCLERLPAVDLAHVDLSRRKQRPEQHGGGFGGQQHGLRLDPPLEREATTSPINFTPSNIAREITRSFTVPSREWLEFGLA